MQSKEDYYYTVPKYIHVVTSIKSTASRWFTPIVHSMLKLKNHFISLHTCCCLARILRCFVDHCLSFCTFSFQKNQYLDRYIPGSSTCSTKELSITMTKILQAVKVGLTRPGFEPTIYRTRGQRANHYVTDPVLSTKGQTTIYKTYI
jgi:hypothetical protein